MIRYTQEQVNFLTSVVLGHSYKEIIQLFNNKFNFELTTSQIKSFIGNRKLNTGKTGRFEKGNIPYNKDIKGLKGANKTSFKIGNKPYNWVPIGSERTNADGYIEIKIQDGKLQRNWKGKHIIIWEQHNGKVPKGHTVIFGDKNNRNFDISNLICLSRQQLAVMNKNKLIKDDNELTKTGVIIADLIYKVNEKRRNNNV